MMVKILPMPLKPSWPEKGIGWVKNELARPLDLGWRFFRPVRYILDIRNLAFVMRQTAKQTCCNSASKTKTIHRLLAITLAAI